MSIIKNKNSSYTSLKYLVIITFSFLFVLITFLGSYSYIMSKTYNSYETTLNSFIILINKDNTAIANLMNVQTIDLEKARITLPTIISDLQKTKDKLSAINLNDKYNSTKLCLIQGLTSNINLYTQLGNVFKTPEAADVSFSTENLKLLRQNCLKFYAEATKGRLSITLTPQTLKFIDSSIFYIDQIIKLKENKDITTSQTSDFITDMNNILKTFISLKTDFKPYLKSSSSHDNLITQININKTAVINLKIELAKLSIPNAGDNPQPLNIFEKMKSTLEDYSTYLDTFTVSLANDLSNFYDEKQYASADIKLEKVDLDYETFVETYNTYKNIE